MALWLNLETTSTKTRIETILFHPHLLNPYLIWKQHPLKQGLKLFLFTGLATKFKIWKQHPLKQGLKLLLGAVCNIYCPIWKQHPLKQGLKLRQGRALLPTYFYLETTSTKTRIET